MPVAIYNPRDIILTFGLITVTGYADGTMVAVEPLGEPNKMLFGTSGEVAFVSGLSRGARIKFTLQLTANCNGLLSAHLAAGNPIVPVALKAPGYVAAGAQSKLEWNEAPAVELTKDVPSIEWSILVGRLQAAARGNVVDSVADAAARKLRSAIG